MGPEEPGELRILTTGLGIRWSFRSPAAEFDVVTCTHIYEHVPDAQRMMDEIYRVLGTGRRLCYFAAENRIRLWDGHYDLPSADRAAEDSG